MNGKLIRVFSGFVLILILAVAMILPTASAMTLKKVATWFWGGPGGETHITSTAIADVDGDGKKEVVTGGYFKQLTADTYEAQLCVWDAETLALEHVQAWLWGIDTKVASVAVGDVDADGKKEVVTGGSYFTDSSYGQLCVWDGATLALENVISWNTPQIRSYISSVAVGDVDSDGKTEIVTANNMRNPGNPPLTQIAVWDGATLALKKEFTPWVLINCFWINSIALGDVDGDYETEIVEGGYYEISGVKRAALFVYDGATLTLENYKAWDWSATSTVINSVVVGDVDGDLKKEVVTGGYYDDGTHDVAQLCVWDVTSWTLEDIQVWSWVGDTVINSVAFTDVDGDFKADVVTGGHYYGNAQLCVWDGATLSLKDVTCWKWSSATYINSVAALDVDGDWKAEVATGGTWYNSYEYEWWTQLCVWDWYTGGSI